VQQVQEMPADGIVVRFHFDALAGVREVVPVKEHRAEAGHQPVGDIARRGELVIVGFGQHRPERGAGRAHDVHRVGIRRHAFEDALHARRNAAQRLELALVGVELGGGGQLAVDEQVGDLLEFAALRDVQDVVPPIVQVVARAPHGAQRGVARRDAGERDGFLRLRCGHGGGRVGAHCFSPF